MTKAERPIEGIQIKIADANRDQLRQAAEDMGIPVNKNTPAQFIIKQMKHQGWDEDYIVVRPPEPEDTSVKEPMVRLTLQNQEGPGGKSTVFVAVNGIGILIPRNRPVEVKLRYLNALLIAIQTTYELIEDPITKRQEMQASDSQVVPVSVERMPSDEEIARWKAYEKLQPEWHNSITPPKKAAHQAAA